MALLVGPDPAYLHRMVEEENAAFSRAVPQQVPNTGGPRGGPWSLSVGWHDGGAVEGEWRDNGWRQLATISAPIEVDVELVFAALDREHYSPTSIPVRISDAQESPWQHLPSVVLDQIIGSMELVDIVRCMQTCRRFFDHVCHSYPLWSRVAVLLKPLAHDAAHLIPDDLDRPAFELYQLCTRVLKELCPTPTMEYFLNSTVSSREVKIEGRARRFKIFPETDQVAVLCSSAGLFCYTMMRQWLEVFPLSRIGNGVPILTIELERDWFIKDYFIQGRLAVICVSGRGNWPRENFPVLLSIPLDRRAGVAWEPVFHADRRTEISYVAVNSNYIVAVVRVPNMDTHNMQLHIWPMREDGSTYVTDPIIRPLHHFVAGLALCGTQLGLLRLPHLWSRPTQDFCCLTHTATYDAGPQVRSQRVILEMHELGSPSAFVGPGTISFRHAALHEDDQHIFPGVRFVAPKLELIDPRSRYFREHLPSATHYETDAAGEVYVSSGLDHLRVGPFVISQKSLGQFYRLEKDDPSEVLVPQQRHLILQMGRGERVLVDAVTMNSYIGEHYFAGHNLLYTDGNVLYLRQIPFN